MDLYPEKKKKNTPQNSVIRKKKTTELKMAQRF